MDNSYYLYGASGHAKVIIEIIEKAGGKVLGLYDDDPLKVDLLNYNISNDKSIFSKRNIKWIISIGDNLIRKKVAENNYLFYETAVDIDVILSSRIQIGAGSVIMPGATINSSTRIGQHSIINTNASIDHDCEISDFVHVSPNATLCGGVSIGEGTHIGAGVVVIPGIKIGQWAKIGAGSIIIKDVPDFATVVGNPGRIIKNKVNE